MEGEFFGTAIIGTKGQFVIPKQARDKLDMRPGDQIVLFGGKEGVMAVMKADQLSGLLAKLGIDDVLK
ncbi:AbrB/MazE/SpoVT family DNA-binding domain-containing protein [Candidatus Nomurabacteria bacterium]|nr:AbrB/MazE/SpoVT family DNA-binding domain-containing protein [Candidatus Nomurabacteria bacterium]